MAGPSDKKPSSSGGANPFAIDLTMAELFWGTLIVIALIEIWFSWLTSRGIDMAWILHFLHLDTFVYYWKIFLPYIRILLRILTVVFVFGIAYAVFEAKKIEKKMDAELYPEIKEETAETVINRKWQRVEKYMESGNTSDWQLAILEADIMLDELLEKSGYHGDTMGDKLKLVDKSDFNTIDMAWDAHKVRNMIAHEGADFVLTEREARRVIELYRQVFKEFDYI